MNAGGSKVDMPHPLTPDARMRNLDTAAVTDDSPVLDSLVLPAEAFPIAFGTENPLTEQSVLLRPVGPVVDRFGFLNLSIGPRADLVWRRDSYTDGIKIFTLTRLMYQAKKVFHVFFLDSVLFDH